MIVIDFKKEEWNVKKCTNYSERLKTQDWASSLCRQFFLSVVALCPDMISDWAAAANTL